MRLSKVSGNGSMGHKGTNSSQGSQNHGPRNQGESHGRAGNFVSFSAVNLGTMTEVSIRMFNALRNQWNSTVLCRNETVLLGFDGGLKGDGRKDASSLMVERFVRVLRSIRGLRTSWKCLVQLVEALTRYPRQHFTLRRFEDTGTRVLAV